MTTPNTKPAPETAAGLERFLRYKSPDITSTVSPDTAALVYVLGHLARAAYQAVDRLVAIGRHLDAIAGELTALNINLGE